MRGFEPWAAIAPHQRAPLTEILERLVAAGFDRVALQPEVAELTDRLDAACPEDGDLFVIAHELADWVRWHRAPAYWLTYLFQLVTQRRGSTAHVWAALLFADSQAALADDMALSATEVAWRTVTRIEAALPEPDPAIAAVREEIVRRLRVQHAFYARWSRPFDYLACNPLAEHLYDRRVADSIAAAYPDLATHLSSRTPPAERAATLIAIAEQARDRGDTYHWITARRFAALDVEGAGDMVQAEVQLRRCLTDAREFGLEAEIGHLLRHHAWTLKMLKYRPAAARALEQALAHEQPIGIFGYWYGLTARELGDVRGTMAVHHQGGLQVGLDSALDAYGSGRRLLDVVLTGGGPPAGIAIKRQMLRSYADNALGTALLRGRIADALAEVEATGPQDLAMTLAEIRAAAALPDRDPAEFQRTREVFHRHLTSVPESFDDYLADLPGQYDARRAYQEERGRITVLGGRVSDEIVDRLLAHRGDDRLVLAFFLGPRPTSRVVLLDLADGSLDERPLGATEDALRTAHQEYVAALADAAELADPRDATRQALDAFLGAVEKVVGPALELVAAHGRGRRLVVVPRMQLNAVPFQALRCRDGPVLDVVADIAVVPSLGVLADRLEASVPRTGGLIAIHDAANTPFFAGTLRALAVRRAIRVLKDPDTEEAVTALSESAGDDVLFACHGIYEADRPGASALRVGSGTGLSLSRLSTSGVALSKCRTMVLGACESGLARAEIGSEYVGLAGVLLSSGVPNVIASLWQVNQLSTAILLDECLAMLGSDVDAPEALAAAQRALRDVTAEAVREWVATNVPELAAALGGVLAKMEERPFSHPDDWAGFVASGIGHPHWQT